MSRTVLNPGQYLHDIYTYILSLKDTILNAIETIDSVHHQIHSGCFYTVSKTFTSVAKDGYADIRLVTPTNAACHLVITISNESKVYLKTYSGTTYSATGTEYTPFNRVAGLTNTARTKVYYTPTIDVTGTQRGDDMLPGSSKGPSRIGFGGGGLYETVLLPSRDHLIRVQNKDTSSAADINIILNFYEIYP